MSDVRYIDIREFRERGYLQEVNRLMLHPLGLALEVMVETCDQCHGNGEAGIGGQGGVCARCAGAGKHERLGGVWDYRDDPEGMLFAGAPGSMIDREKMDRVAAELDQHIPGREAVLGPGRFIQVPGDEVAEDGPPAPTPGPLDPPNHGRPRRHE